MTPVKQPASNAKREQKERTHAEILRATAELIRERGIAAASVANVMGKLGLTVGGFYAHFESKDALIAQVLGETLGNSWQALIARHADKPRSERIGAIVDGYLSVAHRDSKTLGCPMPAVVSELPEQDVPVRKAFREGLLGNAKRLAEATELPEDDALGLVALLVGSLVLARATRGSSLSERLLTAGRRAARLLIGAQS